MKIFDFTWPHGDSAFVFAPDKDTAVDFYKAQIGEHGLLGCEKIEEIPKERWSCHYILDPNETEPDPDESYDEDDYCNGYKIIESFADYAKREKSTDIICTTEY
mgnify:CR=1 FL=1